MDLDDQIEFWLDEQLSVASDNDYEDIDYAQLEAEIQNEVGLGEQNIEGENDESGGDENVYITPEIDEQQHLLVEQGAGDAPPRPRKKKNDEPVMVWELMNDFEPRREVFMGGAPGPKIPIENSLDIFESFFDRQLVQLIVNNTNSYAEQERSKKGMLFPRRSADWNWKEVTVEEMYVYLALLMLMSINQKPSVRCYFSKNPLLETPIFPSTMSRERFEIISKYLHFSDIRNFSQFQGPKQLFKIYDVIHYLNSKFQSNYNLSQNVSIDESLTLWKGRLSFKQYIPLKAAQFGIKSFELCESSSGYTWKLLVYTGKNTVYESPSIPPKSSKSVAIVISLLEPLLDQGFTVWMDNWYNSPGLSQLLKSRRTDTCGTMKQNRKNVPEELKTAKLEKGEMTAFHCGQVVAMKWRDKRVVTLISTLHNHEMDVKKNKFGKEEIKPQIVMDYNKHMGGVDVRDQMLHAFLLERKRGLKWYVKLFKRFLNISILNSYIIWKSKNPKSEHLEFRLDLVKKLLEKYGPEVGRPVFGRPSTAPKPARLTERHFIDRIPPSDKKAKPQKRCCVCYKHGVRRDTVFWCPECEAGLCVGQCFKDYHTKADF